MQDLTLLPSASIFARTTVLPATTIPTSMVIVQLNVDRSLVDSQTLDIDWALELSIDGGVNWMGWGGGGNHGDNTKASILDSALTTCIQFHGLLAIVEDATGATRIAVSEVPVGWTIVSGFE